MNDSRVNQKIRKRKKIRWFRISLLVLFVLLFGGGAYFYNVYSNVAQAVNKMNKPVLGGLSTNQASKKLNSLDPISILLVGDDHRSDEQGSNTDTMIVITINAKTKTTKMLSIPRDTRTELIDKKDPTKNRVDKINAAYAYGGPEMLIDTVGNFLNIPIDYLVEVNFQGFQDIVNTVGGIDVNNQYPFELNGVTLKAGPQHLNGYQALQYARMRHQDPRGDFGRQERQHEVITKVVDKAKSMSTLVNYDKMLKALSNNITTNLTLDDMISLAKSYKPATKNIENVSQVEGQGATIGYSWYLLVGDQERQTLSDELCASLNLAPSPVTKFYKGTGIINNFSTTRMTVSELHEHKI
ncbi:LCP family protein [Neobacillus sp. PS3-12]|jgi:polyisoprenyl-teichoic acid--peptidoglycan teichoic acid transferase|uniref:LCP family glycopolymer transferase n=1 Tax=Neobacillus sp. PS3-12 TaxID=3070677 RepID=UPI0027DF0935|nr:LCP family protein [Neobacillus sp. PS3-12]WML51090.1 LCP family protein [Neobacillus sp. PS3-12]